MAGDCLGDVEWNIKAELAAHVANVLRCEDDRDFNGHGDRVSEQHESLNFIVATLIIGDGLEHQVGNSASVVALGFDLNGVEVERGFALRCAIFGVCPSGVRTAIAIILEEVVRAVLGHVGKIVSDWLKGLMFLGAGDEVELAHVSAIHVDLLMMQAG